MKGDVKDGGSSRRLHRAYNSGVSGVACYLSLVLGKNSLKASGKLGLFLPE